MSARGRATDKRKRVLLTIPQKIEVIRKLENGASVGQVCEEYNIKKQTVSDIRKAKGKLTEYFLKYEVNEGSSKGKKDSQSKTRKKMRVAKQVDLDEAEIQSYYEHLRTLREVVIRQQNMNSKQLKLDSFFKTPPKEKNKNVSKGEPVSGGAWKPSPELSDDADDDDPDDVLAMPVTDSD